MLDRVLSSLKVSKRVSNDSQNFPDPAHYMVEDLEGCEPFKVYLENPERTAKGWYVWKVTNPKGEQVTIVCFSANQRKQYRDQKGFIARFPCLETNTVRQGFLKLVAE